MSDYDYDEMIRRIRHGQYLSAEELAHVKRELADPDSPNRSTALEIVGASMDTSAAELVESLLVCPQDPWLSRSALQVLCLYWGRTGDYLTYLEEYIGGVAWDVDNEVKHMAMSLAGGYLREHRHRGLLKLLVDRAEQGPVEADEVVPSDLTWQIAVEDLAKALGYDREDLPVISEGFDPDDLLAPRFDPDDPGVREIIRRARRRLADEEHQGRQDAQAG